MSVINAIVEIRGYRASNTTIDLGECCRVLRFTPGSVASYDYRTAQELNDAPGLLDGVKYSREENLREVLRRLLIHLRPMWGLLIPQGRNVFYSHVSDDIKQCFCSAGLFESLPDERIVEWWDGVSEYFRSASVLERVELGRRGEMLSMNYERQKLVLGGFGYLSPKWTALEDNSAGYDLESFEITNGNAPTVKYIEVKASERKPFMFFVSENEWRVAQLLGDRYVFHFWSLPAETLVEVPAADVVPHIPINQGNGTWRKTLVVWQEES